MKRIGGVLLLVLTFFAGWFINGWRIGSKIDALKSEYAIALQKSEHEARAKEQALQADHDANRKKHEEEIENAKNEIDQLRARISNGTVRLSVPATACTVSENSGAGIEQTRAELDPQTANDLVTVAADGDAAIRDLNQCIDQYNTVAKAHRPG